MSSRNRITVTQAVRITGGLSRPSKMPGRAWSISAKRCMVGSRLRKIPGSTCSTCYALKGRYIFPNVQAAQENRYQCYLRAVEGSAEDYRAWHEAMVFLIDRYCGGGHFRWFDSGDIQSITMLMAIFDIARDTPNVQHWLPTREAAIVRRVSAFYDKPPNLRIRLSGVMIDGPIPEGGSGVYRPKTGPQTGAFPCDAKSRGGHCGTCRFCWENDGEVTYPVH